MLYSTQTKLYSEYVDDCIAKSAMPISFAAWNSNRIAFENTNKPFSIGRFSEIQKATVFFQLSARDKYEANDLADKLMIQYENRLKMEYAEGKPLSQAEQIAKLESEISKMVARAEKKVQKELVSLEKLRLRIEKTREKLAR